MLVWVLGCAPSRRRSGKPATSWPRRRTARSCRSRTHQVSTRFVHPIYFFIPLILLRAWVCLLALMDQWSSTGRRPTLNLIVFCARSYGGARRRRESQAPRGGDGVRLRGRAGHVVHARPGQDPGPQWQLVTSRHQSSVKALFLALFLGSRMDGHGVHSKISSPHQKKTFRAHMLSWSLKVIDHPSYLSGVAICGFRRSHQSSPETKSPFCTYLDLALL